MKNRTKITSTIITSLLIGLIALLPMAITQNVNAQATPFVVPPSPTAVGCYHYAKNTGWQSTACASEEELKQIRLNHPAEGAASGVEGESVTATQTLGETDVKFTAYNSETDSGKGTTNTWSIQTNTNQWLVSGNTYQVQFTEQNQPGQPTLEHACLWQIKVNTPQDYTDVHCVAVPQQTLSSSFEGETQGFTVSGGNLEAEYCNVVISQCYGVITSDDHQLGTHWTANSGTILGVANSSTANFVSTSTETTKVMTGPATTASFINDTSTQEKNNMSYGTHSIACASNICTLTVTSTK